MLPIEYDAIWCKKMTLHSMIFLVSRYGLSGQLGFNAFAGSYGSSFSDTVYVLTAITLNREHSKVKGRCSVSYSMGTVFRELSTTAPLCTYLSSALRFHLISFCIYILIDLIALRIAAIYNRTKVALFVATALIIPYEIINVYVRLLRQSFLHRADAYGSWTA